MERETLLQLKTEQWTLCLRGRKLNLTHTLPMRIHCADADQVSAQFADKTVTVTGEWVMDAPAFAQQRLQVILQTKVPVELTPGLEDSVRNEDGTFQTGYWNLEDTIGPASLTAEYAGTRLFQLEIDVCPGNASFRQDFEAMETELEQMLRKLAVQQSRQLDPDFLKGDVLSLDTVSACLHESYAALLSAADEVLQDGEVSTGLRLLKRRSAYDTPENRLTKYILRSAVRWLSNVSVPDEWFGELNRRAASPCLSHAGQYKAAEETRPDAMAPAYQLLHLQYQRLCCCCAVLQLHIVFDRDKRPQLYRYWSFMKLAQMLAERYTLVHQTVLRLAEGQISFAWPKDTDVRMSFHNAADGKTISLSLQPDGEILLQQSGGFTYAFLPCYRTVENRVRDMDLRQAYQRRNELFFQKKLAAVGAFVLYPGTDDPDYRQSESFCGILRERVGAVALVPGAAQLLERLLDKLLFGIPMADFSPAVLPTELEMQLEQVDWSKRNVLVGVLRNPEQLDLCLKRHFYHMPASLVEQSAHPIGYVALYQSRNLFGRDAGIRYYGEVAEYNAVPRYTIRELPSYSKETYYRFAVKKWHMLPQTIQVQDRGSLAKLTNLFLLQNSSHDTALLIETEEMFRLQNALQQAVESAGNDSAAEVGFAMADCTVAVYQGKIWVFRERTCCVSIETDLWQKCPRQVLEQIYACLYPCNTTE